MSWRVDEETDGPTVTQLLTGLMQDTQTLRRQDKPRHGFLDTGAELTRPCLVNIGFTSNHAASRLHEPLNMYEAEH